MGARFALGRPGGETMSYLPTGTVYGVLLNFRAEVEALAPQMNQPPYKYPRFIEFVDELPKTATGKIQRFRLREREQK